MRFNVGRNAFNRGNCLILAGLLITLILQACSNGSNQDDGTVSKDKFSAPLPSAVSALAVDETNLVVGVVVDGGDPQACTNLTVDQVNATYSCSISLPGGVHTLALIYSIIEDPYGTVQVATTSGVEVEVIVGQTTSANFSNVIITYIDSDGDGANNIDELNNGTDPTVADLFVVTGVTPAANSLINGTTPIVITFSQSVNPDSISITGSMISTLGIQTSFNEDYTVLTVTTLDRWVSGNQELVVNGSSEPAGIELTTLTLEYTVDTVAPTFVVTPASGSAIQNTRTISIVFSESMDTDSFNASGSLWDESNQGGWSQTNSANDTLTLGPTTTWSDGLKTLVISISDLAGNALSTTGIDYTVDAVLPVASVSPLSGGALAQSESIVIQFTESMDIDSLNGSGSLWDQSNQGVWSYTNNNNDTLTISPVSQWNLGSGNLTIDIMDLVGNALETLNINYSVGCDAGLTPCSGACVDLSADTANCGSCGRVCGGVANASASACTSGNCEIVSCNSGFGDCNSQFDDGCEVNTTNDSANCGGCNNNCIDNVTCTADSCVDSQCLNSPDDSQCNDIIGSWGACGNFAGACTVSGTRTRTITPRICTPTGCTSGTPYNETEACTRPDQTGSVCSTTYGAWSACGGFTSTCDETGSQSRTVTTYTCQAESCGSPVNAVEARLCTRNTDGNSCNSGAGTCSNGSCVQTNPCGPNQVWCGGTICVTPPQVCP